MLVDDGYGTSSFATEADGDKGDERAGDGAKAMVRLKCTDCGDLCSCYAVSDGEGVDGEWSLDVENGLLSLNMLKFASQQVVWKMVGLL